MQCCHICAVSADAVSPEAAADIPLLYHIPRRKERCFYDSLEKNFCRSAPAADGVRISNALEFIKKNAKVKKASKKKAEETEETEETAE